VAAADPSADGRFGGVVEPAGLDAVQGDRHQVLPAPSEGLGDRAVFSAEIEVDQGWVVGVQGAQQCPAPSMMLS